MLWSKARIHWHCWRRPDDRNPKSPMCNTEFTTVARRTELTRTLNAVCPKCGQVLELQYDVPWDGVERICRWKPAEPCRLG